VVSELGACNLRAVDSTHVSNICNPTLFRSQGKLIIDSSANAVFPSTERGSSSRLKNCIRNLRAVKGKFCSSILRPNEAYRDRASWYGHDAVDRESKIGQLESLMGNRIVFFLICGCTPAVQVNPREVP